MVTISTMDPAVSAARYEQQLGYRPVERGRVDPQLARSWGADRAGKRRYVLLQSPDTDAVYLRFVESRGPAGYRPLRSAGWSALELLTRNPYELRRTLRGGPFNELAPPAPLTEGSSIHAMQYRGPDGEILYLTADLGGIASSTLARTEHPVGRPFIVVAASADLDSLSGFYRDRFALEEAFRLRLSIPFMAEAQSLRADHRYPLALLRLAAFSHSIELDEYPSAPARPRLTGELPPGIAVVTFCGSPAELSARPPGKAYGGAAVQVLQGAAGELIEIIDCAAAAGSAGGP